MGMLPGGAGPVAAATGSGRMWGEYLHELDSGNAFSERNGCILAHVARLDKDVIPLSKNHLPI
jgi:hypothetical protein